MTNHMPQTIETTEHHPQPLPKRVLWAPIMAVIAIINSAFMLGLATTLTWRECAAVALVAVVLAGGAIFTYREMQRLAR